MIAIVAISAIRNGSKGNPYSVCHCFHDSKDRAKLWQRSKTAISIAIVSYCK